MDWIFNSVSYDVSITTLDLDFIWKHDQEHYDDHASSRSTEARKHDQVEKYRIHLSLLMMIQ